MEGERDYGELAQSYVRSFEQKWLGGHAAPEESLLGTADLQSLADLSGSVDLVRNMRLAPVSLRLLASLAMAALVPMLPLLLYKYPLSELAEKFFARLTGL